MPCPSDDDFHESSQVCTAIAYKMLPYYQNILFNFMSFQQTGSVWWHYLVVIVNGSIYITGGSNGLNSFPQAKEEDISA